MKSHSVMQAKGGGGGSLSNTQRNARQRRLKIRRMKSAGGVNKVFNVAGEDDACCTQKRNCIDSKDIPVSEEQPEHTRHEKKLKGVVGNVEGESLCSSYDSSEFLERSCELPHQGGVESETDLGVGGSQSVTRLSYGSISVMGRSRVMEDTLTVAPGIIAGEYEFFAAYDGHGGATVAHACHDRLHQLLEMELSGDRKDESSSSDDKTGIDWTRIMEACFSKMDEEVQTSHDRKRVGVGVESDEIGEAAAERGTGSTAVVAMVGTEELVVANCGDSRAVLCRGGVALPLSNDHKPDRPDEKERVEAAGGRIINWDGCRVQGVLATSRSIGDHYLKPYVISKPEVTVNKRTDLDEFLVVATDGLWDVVSNDTACEVVKRCLFGQISKNLLRESGTAAAAVILAELAIAKGSRDNISVIVVDLKKAKASSKVSGT